MIVSKPIVGVISFVGVVGSGALAYKLGVFGREEPVITTGKVQQQLKEQGYELISENSKSKEQWKISFNAFKSDATFMLEINKHTENKETLTNADNGEKGKLALEKLCDSYLKGDSDFTNASKWCVLRIQDRAPSGGWLPLVDGNDDVEANKTKWKGAFKKHHTSLTTNNIKGITSSTQEEQGHTLLKQWCSENLALSFNKERESIFGNASVWCVATT